MIVNLNLPLLPPMTLDSLVGSSKSIEEEHKSISPHVSTDLDFEGINGFGTNTFQMQSWMTTPSLSIENQMAPTLSTVEPNETILPIESQTKPIARRKLGMD